jgi:predicted ATP-dependent serine protease
MREWDQKKFEREILEEVERVSAPKRGGAAEAGRRNGNERHQPPPVRRDERTADQKPLSAETLMTLTFSPIKYVVPGIIVEGLTLLAGKPKLGKSWLLLHAAIAVARGGFTLGDIH